MKRIFILLALISVLSFLSCKKDDNKTPDTNTVFVNKSPEGRKVVLEEFTGVKCGYCPDGHEIMKQIMNENPGKAICFSIHGGTYSVPYAGDPDLTSPWAAAIISFSQLTGYPAGMVNREDLDNDGKLAIGRGSWKSHAAQILASGNSPVNIGIKSTFNSSSRLLTIKVQYYYTADGNGTNKLNVGILESGIMTQQAGATTNPYEQNNVLRDFLTGQWGDEITTTTAGTLGTKTYTYTIPSGWNIAKCDVIAYITKGDNKKIYSGEKVAANGGSAN
jgi:hypothetical protein